MGMLKNQIEGKAIQRSEMAGNRAHPYQGMMKGKELLPSPEPEITL